MKNTGYSNSIKKTASPFVPTAVLTIAICASGSFAVSRNQAITYLAITSDEQASLSVSNENAVADLYRIDKYSVSIKADDSPIIINNEVAENAAKIDRIAKLKENWNGNGAEPFSATFLDFVKKLIVGLCVQPELFPTACDSIQLEYSKGDGGYLEIQLYERGKADVFEIRSDGFEAEYQIEKTTADINRTVNAFYG